MSNTTDQYQDLNLIGLLRDLWAAKVFLAVGLLLGLFVAFVFMAAAQPKYEARMMVGPAQPMDASMQARFQDGQNSYVLPAERPVSSEVVSNFVRFEAMRRGVSVSRLLLRDDRILQGLRDDKTFVFDDGRTGVQPTELAYYIGRRVKMDRFGETALKEMVYKHSDPEFAAYFLQKIHRTTDQLIRADLRNKVDEQIAYLERVIAKTINPEQRRIMTNLLLEQERARMMVSMDAPVAASVYEPAAAGAYTVWPDAGLFYGGLGLLGLMLGYFVFGVVHYKGQMGVADEVAPVRRGADLQHKPKRPLKYGSWFRGAPDNDERPPQVFRKKDASDAAE